MIAKVSGRWARKPARIAKTERSEGSTEGMGFVPSAASEASRAKPGEGGSPSSQFQETSIAMGYFGGNRTTPTI
jgi:hypothetical protein